MELVQPNSDNATSKAAKSRFNIQASMDWEPYTPVFRKEALPTAVLYGPFPLEGRHGTGYLQQPSSREELVQITIPQANSGIRIA